MKYLLFLVFASLVLAAAGRQRVTSGTIISGWPQMGRDNQRTARSTATVNGSGTVRWRWQPTSGVYSILQPPTVAADGTTIAFCTESEDGEVARAFGLSPDGKIMWHYALPGAWAGADLDTFSTPSLSSGGILYYNTQNTTFAVVASSGKVVWQMASSDGAIRTGAPALYEPEGYVFIADWGRVYALDVSSGNERWRYSFPTPTTNAVTVFFALSSDGATVYAALDYGLDAATMETPALVALDATTGNVKWAALHGLAVGNGGLLVGDDGSVLASVVNVSNAAELQFSLLALRNATGIKRWSHALDKDITAWGSIALDGGSGTDNGDVVFSAWTRGIDTLVVLACNTTTGLPVWSINLPGGPSGDLAVASNGGGGRAVYFGTSQPPYSVYSLNATSGDTLWQAEGVLQMFVSAAVVSDTGLLLLTTGDEVLAF